MLFSLFFLLIPWRTPEYECIYGWNEKEGHTKLKYNIWFKDVNAIISSLCNLHTYVYRKKRLEGNTQNSSFIYSTNIYCMSTICQALFGTGKDCKTGNISVSSPLTFQYYFLGKGKPWGIFIFFCMFFCVLNFFKRIYSLHTIRNSF